MSCTACSDDQRRQLGRVLRATGSAHGYNVGQTLDLAQVGGSGGERAIFTKTRDSVICFLRFPA